MLPRNALFAALLPTRRRFLLGVGAFGLAVSGCAAPLHEHPAPRPLPPPPPAPPPPPPEPPAKPVEDEVEPAPPKGPWTLDLPPRKVRAETGSQFIDQHAELKRVKFEAAVLDAVLSGNVPSFLRTLVPLDIRGTDKKGKRHQATLHVATDYLAIGSDKDFIRMPMTPATAQRIAKELGCTLPTTKLVDEIYRQATNKLPPKWIEGGPNIENHWDYKTHEQAIEEQFRLRRLSTGVLTAGHMKDIVLCNDLAKRPKKVAIYGWHRESGKPIQPLTTVHSCNYADYSHGVRLVSESIVIDGEATSLDRVLRDRQLSALFSDEGPLVITSYPV